MTIISKKKKWKSVGELSQVHVSPIVLKCLYLARIGWPDVLWSVNKLARSITKWTKACDKRLTRLISYIHRTCEWETLPNKQTGTVPLQLSRRSWGFEIYIRWNIVHFWKLYICTDHLGVQEANVSFSHLHRILDHIVRCWFANGWFSCVGLVGWLLKYWVCHTKYQNEPKRAHGKPV